MPLNNFFFNLNKEVLSTPENFNGFIILYQQADDINIEQQQQEMINSLLSNGFKIEVTSSIIIPIQASSNTIQLPKSNDIKILLFGVDTKFIGLQIDAPLNKIVKFRNNSIIYTYSAKAMLEQPKYKKQFWETVQDLLK